VEDLTGGGDHLQVKVVSDAFSGLNRIKQHPRPRPANLNPQLIPWTPASRPVSRP
jgi:acid stress-induced BolA-like protein IbaG/YrbA